MRSHKFWWPVIASLAATPVFLFLLVASAGVGHSDTRGAACVLFPYAGLASNLFGTKDMPFFALLVVQYPLYGLALGAGARHGRFFLALGAVLAAHVLAAAACFGTAGESLS